MLRIILSTLLCWALGLSPLLAQLHNKGATLKIQSGAFVKTTMDVQNTDGGALRNAGTLTTAQSLSNSTGATLIGDGAYRVGNNWVNSATFTAGTSSVTFDGAQNSAATSGGSAFYNLNLNKSATYDLVLNDAMSIGNTLGFQATGNYLLPGNNNLTLGTVTGADATRFIVTGGTGRVFKNVTAAFTFPIGFSKTTYNPLTLTQSGTPDVLGARCLENMLANGAAGSPFTQKAADVSWDVTEQTPGGSSLALQFQWAGSDELPLFNRALMAAQRYNGANWVAAGSGGSATGSNPYQFSIAGITAPGIFAVTKQCFFCLDFSGRIAWSNDLTTGVKDATVNLTGAATGSGLTNVNGNYLISIPSGTGSFSLKPVKNINKLNGVTAADVTAIQQHVTNIVLITNNYLKVAADVNKSNSITTLDATVINQALLGNPSALAQFKTSWRFVPQSHTMNNPPWGFPEQINLTGVSTNQSGLDFYGIKTGDVVTTYANPANFGAGEPLVWRVSDQVLKAGETVVAEFRADQLDDLAAFQFALYFDPGALQFDGVEVLGGLPVSMDNIGLYNLSGGEIRVVWSQATSVSLAETAPVFRLRFTALQSGGKLSEALGLNEEVLPGRVYNSALTESGMQLLFGAATATVEPVARLLLLQNRPNPFSAETIIEFMLPGACDAQLRITDATGRELLRLDKSYPAGYNAETIRLDGSNGAGVLYYELTTVYGTVSRKMVKQL